LDVLAADVERKIRSFILACAICAIDAFAFLSPARAGILSLECHRGSDPGWLAYWIDMEKGTITMASGGAQGVELASVEIHPVKITPEAFTFVIAAYTLTINRLTGWNTWPDQPPFLCAAGTLPLPAGKFWSKRNMVTV
jgi:hypothetical protein